MEKGIMFLNLVKYDLKFILKTVLIYAILLLLSAALHNLTSYGYTPTTMDPSTGQIFDGEPDASILIQILHTVFYNAVIAMLIALLLNTIIRTWARFKLNFYSDEAYLTHTLPVTRSLLWASKCFSAAIVIVTVIAVTGLACALLNLTPTGQGLAGAFGVVKDAPFSYYLAYILGVFTQFSFITLCGFVGIIIGYRFQNHHILRAILAGFGIYLLSILFMFSIMLFWGNFDTSIQMGIFEQVENPHEFFSWEFISKILSYMTFIYAVEIAILYCVGYKLLRHGINLD